MILGLNDLTYTKIQIPRTDGKLHLSHLSPRPPWRIMARARAMFDALRSDPSMLFHPTVSISVSYPRNAQMRLDDRGTMGYDKIASARTSSRLRLRTVPHRSRSFLINAQGSYTIEITVPELSKVHYGL